MSFFLTITWFPAFQIIKTAHQCFSTSMWCSNELFLTINVISALHGDAYHHHGQYTYMHELPNRDLIRHEALKLRFSFTFWLSHLPPKFPQLKRECVWLKPTVIAISRWLTKRAFIDELKIENSLGPGWLKNRPNPLWVGLERVVIWWDQL